MVPDETAIMFQRQTVDDVAAAISRCLATTWSETRLRQNAVRFSPERFRTEFRQAVSSALLDPGRVPERD